MPTDAGNLGTDGTEQINPRETDKKDGCRPPDRLKESAGSKSLFGRSWASRKRQEVPPNQSENSPSEANAGTEGHRKQRLPSFSLSRAKKEPASLPPLVASSVEVLTDEELSDLTRSNTKRNAHRNLKARLARAHQTLKSLTTTTEMGALPVVRPNSPKTTQNDLTSASFSQIHQEDLLVRLPGRDDIEMAKVVSTEHEFNNDSSMDFEPASFNELPVEWGSRESKSILSSTKGSMSTLSSQKGLVRPSVRISSSVSVVSAIDLKKSGREAVQLIDLDEHPSRNSSRTFKPMKSTDGKLLVK